MKVILYNTSSPPNVVNKNLGKTSKTIDGMIFKEDNALSVLNPTLLIKLSGNSISELANYNYLKIPVFDRYYWFDVGETRGGLVEIKCKVDPLMSFKDDIKDDRKDAPKQYIIRSQAFTNKLIVDNLLPMMSNHTLDILPFGDSVYDKSCGHVILETVGKGGTVS